MTFPPELLQLFRDALDEGIPHIANRILHDTRTCPCDECQNAVAEMEAMRDAACPGCGRSTNNADGKLCLECRAEKAGA